MNSAQKTIDILKKLCHTIFNDEGNTARVKLENQMKANLEQTFYADGTLKTEEYDVIGNSSNNSKNDTPVREWDEYGNEIIDMVVNG